MSTNHPSDSIDVSDCNEDFDRVEFDFGLTRRSFVQVLGEGLLISVGAAPAERVRMLLADTSLVPDDGITAGSRTTPATVPAVRQGAAAASRRMGVQKLLLPVRGQPMIVQIVDEVLVVLRQGERDVARALGDRRVRLVVNPYMEGEMLSSVRCGLSALSPESVAALIVLGDQPGIRREVVAALVDSFRSGGEGIVVPTFDGRRGHPLLLAIRYREEILNQYDETGLRGLLQAHAKDVREVEVATPAVLDDIDLPEDYRRLKSAGE